SKTMFLSKLLISRFFLMTSLIVLPMSFSTSNYLTPLHLIYSPYYGIYRSPLYISKPPKFILHHFFAIGVTLTLSNIVIYNFIMSSLTTHPTQRLQLCYIYFILVLVLKRPTFYHIQYYKFYRSPIKLSLQLERYLFVT
ncbi:unnamed protein product, partial [Vicia faba]